MSYDSLSRKGGLDSSMCLLALHPSCGLCLRRPGGAYRGEAIFYFPILVEINSHCVPVPKSDRTALLLDEVGVSGQDLELSWWDLGQGSQDPNRLPGSTASLMAAPSLSPLPPDGAAQLCSLCSHCWDRNKLKEERFTLLTV